MNHEEMEDILDTVKLSFTLDWLARRIKNVYTPEEVKLLIERLNA